MTKLRCFILLLILRTLWSVIVNGEMAPSVQPIERSPSPNLDLYHVQLSLSIGWSDTIDEWFVITISKGKDSLQQIAVTGYKVLGHIVDLVPTPEGILRTTKDVLLGLPQELLVYAVDAFCNIASAVHSIRPSITPKAEEMHLEFLTQNLENIIAPLDNPESICDHSAFRKDWPTVIFITGWNSNINSTNDALEALYSSYRKRDVNFIFFDTGKFVDTLYTWSAFNTIGIGEFIGRSLAKLMKCVEPKQIHLIGHSLGAHMCGYAARTFRNLTNEWIPRITGLDPANPCFREGEALNGLQRGDALFVDIIHSNAGVLGRRSTIGDVDFFPNGRHPLQPGCFTVTCSHSRSWEFYAETVVPGNENNFLAVRCNSYSSLQAGRCGGEPVPMGYAVPITAKGNYFLGTNSKPPYGLGKALFDLYKISTQLRERILYPVMIPEKQLND